MAELQITAFPTATIVPHGKPVVEEKITITGTSAATPTAMPASQIRYKVRLFSDVKCYVTWGVVPVAKIDGTEGRMLGAENPEYVELEPGEKVAVIERV